MLMIAAIDIANDLPTAEGKGDVLIYIFITIDWVNGRETQKGMERFDCPPYPAEPQHMEGSPVKRLIKIY